MFDNPDVSSCMVSTSREGAVPSTRQAWIVCFSAALYFFFEFMQVNMFNAINPSLMQAFHIQAIELAHLSSAYFNVIVVCSFFAGVILDRISTRKIIIAAMLANVMCTVGFALSTAIWQAMICRMIIGAAGAFCLLSCVRLASRWFPPRRMALVVGLIVTFAMTGGMLAQTPFTLAIAAIGWRHTLLLDAGMGALMLLIVIANVRDFPPGASEKTFSSSSHAVTWEVLRNPQNWLGGVYTSLMNLPIFLLGALWGNLYLMQARHLTPVAASWVTSMLFAGTIIGSPVLGGLSDRLALRKMPMMAGAVIAFLLMLELIVATHLSFSALMFLFFGIGFVTSTQIMTYPLIAESNPHALIGGAEGVAATLILAGGFMQIVFAWLMDWRWGHLIIDQIPFYSGADYRHALMIMPVGFVIAFITACCLRETYAKRMIDG